MHCRMLSSPGLYPPDASNVPHIVTTRTVCRHCQLPQGSQNHPDEEQDLKCHVLSVSVTSIAAQFFSFKLLQTFF